MIVLTGEVAFPLHGAIVLAFGVIQYDTHPFPRSKESGANIGNSTPLTLPYHFHYRANLGEKREDERKRVIIVDSSLFIFSPFLCLCWKSDPPLEVYYSPLFLCCSFCWSVGWSAGGFGKYRWGEMWRKMRKWGKKTVKEDWLPMGISPLQTRAFMFKFENYAGFLYPNLGQIDTLI